MTLFPRRRRPAAAPVDPVHLREAFVARHPEFAEPPRIAARLDEVARALGLPQSLIDADEAAIRLRRAFRAMAVEAGARVGDRAVGERLDHVMSAGGPISDDAVWDAFFAGGERTVAAAGPVARFCADGRLVGVAVSAMRRDGRLQGPATIDIDDAPADGEPEDRARARIRALLLGARFEPVGPTRYHGAFVAHGEPARPVWVDLAETLRIFAPFAEFSGHALPDVYRDLHGGHYEIEGLPPFAVLAADLPWEIEDSSFRAEAHAISRQAEAWRRHVVPRLDGR